MGDYRRALTGLSKDGSKEGSNQSSSSALTINPTASFDHSSLQITSYGTVQEPALTDPSHSSWDTNNALVMAWLINSMEEHIGSLYLVHEMAKAIWDKVRLSYSDIENSAQLCELRDHARDLKQGNKSMIEYYTSLTKIWQELDIFEPTNWCGECAGKYAKMLGTHPLPQIKEIFAELYKLLTPEKTTSNSLIAQKGCINLFSSYIPSSRQLKVKIADGSLSPIAGFGTIKINSALILEPVLHVPNLSCNLLSVRRSSGKKISNASEDRGLYYFDEDTDESRQAQTISWKSPSLMR
ncbi:hypothetical protein CK203_049067 [Vitis vinifera]|uniref:Retrovirus-related Pol polyprotein from transposon TNT 1-94-like beta-barrel domain-containing protein n=1 Tax=Vitis vinifera TaxID=29760 RepID=A0A438HC20_VITVI|nr:hypothetical protein CK203_049067 [Vitis vinifera]